MYTAIVSLISHLSPSVVVVNVVAISRRCPCSPLKRPPSTRGDEINISREKCTVATNPGTRGRPGR